MKIDYKLYKPTLDSLTPRQQILYNRNIPVEEQSNWLNADILYSWKLLGETKMVDACKMLYKHIKNNSDIFIPIDSDLDGWCSSAILINYLYKLYPQFVQKHVFWKHHTGKQHGLADMIGEIPSNINFVIVTDAGSNDIKEHKILQQKGIECLVLDHHTVSVDIQDSPALILNVQESDYPNKFLTGGGITFKFCEAYNEVICSGKQSPEWLFDLCAIANIGDMADYHDLEIRSMVRRLQ